MEIPGIRMVIRLLQAAAIRLLSVFARQDPRLYLFGAHHGPRDNPYVLFRHYAAESPESAVWVARNRREYKALQDEPGRVVLAGSLELMHLASRCAAVFFSHGLYDAVPAANPRALKVNLWHGTPIKCIGFDAPVTPWQRWKSWLWARLGRWAERDTDLMIAANEDVESLFEHALHVPRASIRGLGQPRVDSLFANANASAGEQRRIHLSDLGDGKGLVLYAPTFRDDDTDADLLDQLLAAWAPLHREHGLVLGVRLHPVVAARLDLSRLPEYALDLNSELSIEDCFLMSEALITDWSSLAFDYEVLRRPMYLYTAGLDSARAARGGFYWTWNEIRQRADGEFSEAADLVKALAAADLKSARRSSRPLFNRPDAGARVLEFVRRRIATGEESTSG